MTEGQFNFKSALNYQDRRCFIQLYWSIMAAMSRTLRAFPRFNTRPTCMESALMISPWSRFPISIASLDFPVPVAPKITTNDGTIALLKAHCTLRADAAMMLLPRSPADDGAHAYWMCRGEVGSVSRQQAAVTRATVIDWLSCEGCLILGEQMTSSLKKLELHWHKVHTLTPTCRFCYFRICLTSGYYPQSLVNEPMSSVLQVTTFIRRFSSIAASWYCFYGNWERCSSEQRCPDVLPWRLVRTNGRWEMCFHSYRWFKKGYKCVNNTTATQFKHFFFSFICHNYL